MGRRLPGYFTVEASFLVPLVLAVMVFVIYAAFYAYDRCVLLQNTYIEALRAAQVQEMRRFEDERAQEDAEGIGVRPLFMSEAPALDVTSNKRWAESKGRAVFASGGGMLNLIGVHTFDVVQATSRIQVRDTPYVIRRYRRIRHWMQVIGDELERATKESE